MSMEKIAETPRIGKELQLFLDELKNKKSEVALMVEKGEAYVQDVRDRQDNIISYKIFRNDGTLLYFEDVEGLKKARSKFYPQQ